MSKDILIIDDCRLTTKVLAGFIQELGFTAHTARSAEEAVSFLETHEPPGAFFVDWVMPGMSGVEFVTWLREQTYTRETPVLMVTAERDMARIAEAIESGANEYIIKPFSREAIEEKLQILGISSVS